MATLKTFAWISFKHNLRLLFALILASRATFSYAAGDTLVYGIENEIKNYNIARSLDRHAYMLSELVTQALFWQEPNGILHPQLAKKTTYKNALWTIALDEARFSSGKIVTCEDVRANFVEAWTSKRPISGRLRDIKEITCEKNVLKFRTRKESGQLMKRIGALIRVYDPLTLASTNPDGSGPYKVLHREGKDLVLVRNEYFIGETPRFREIRLRTLGDAWLRDLALFSNNVDMLMENFSLLRLKAFLSHTEQSNLYRLAVPELVYVGLNARRFSLDDRKRIEAAIRSSTAVKRFWGDQVGPPDLFARPPPQVVGAGGPIRFEISVAPDETTLAFLRELALDLKTQNIELRLRPLEFASLMKRLNDHAYEAYLASVDVSHPQNLEGLAHSRGNRLGIASPELDQLFERALETSDDKILTTLSRQIDEHIRDAAVLIPLYRPYSTLVTHKRLRVELTHEGFWRDLLRRSDILK